MQNAHSDKHRHRWEKQHHRHRNAIGKIANQKGVFAPNAVGQVAHRQRHQQRSEAAGCYQVAECGFVVSKAEHIKVEQQLADAHGNAKKQQAQQKEPRVAGEGAHAAQVSAYNRTAFLELSFRVFFFQPYSPWTKSFSSSMVFSKPS